MEKYISFTSKIEETLESLDGDASTDDFNNADTRDITKMVDTIIKTGMEKKCIRYPYRTNGKKILG